MPFHCSINQYVEDLVFEYTLTKLGESLIVILKSQLVKNVSMVFSILTRLLCTKRNMNEMVSIIFLVFHILCEVESESIYDNYILELECGPTSCGLKHFPSKNPSEVRSFVLLLG